MSSKPGSPLLPAVLIVSPALAAANNGNWHTAARWARLLRGHCRTAIDSVWRGQRCDLLIALHARRSAPSIDAFVHAHPARRPIVVLTGTDLYRDIRDDPLAQRSLQQAGTLVVLQELGPLALPQAVRAKCVVIVQSAAALTPAPPPGAVLRVAQVGHLRDEKDPRCFMRAALRLRARRDIRLVQVGGALDPAFADAALATQAETPNYRWRGDLPRAAARQQIRTAHLLVNTSRMEGGAQVIVEAARSATAVLASRVDGNVGMLGTRHAGLFELGDDAALAALIERARDEPAFLAMLRAQTVARDPLFEPAEEQRRLLELIATALESRS